MLCVVVIYIVWFIVDCGVVFSLCCACFTVCVGSTCMVCHLCISRLFVTVKNDSCLTVHSFVARTAVVFGVLKTIETTLDTYSDHCFIALIFSLTEAPAGRLHLRPER